MNLHRRVQRLEQRTGGGQPWCRCPFEWERVNAEAQTAMETGDPTPSECGQCGGRRIAIQYVAMDALPA